MNLISYVMPKTFKQARSLLLSMVDKDSELAPTAKSLSDYTWSKLMPILIANIRELDSDGIECSEGFNEFLEVIAELFSAQTSLDREDARIELEHKSIRLFKHHFEGVVDGILFQLYLDAGLDYTDQISADNVWDDRGYLISSSL